MENCIFCKINKGEIPCYKIYEDKYVLAFLDIADDFVGHTLVIPKRHTKNILSAPENTLTHCMNAVKKISNHYIDNCGYDGVDVISACNQCGEQSVFHLHFHIIPRKNADGLCVLPKNSKQFANFEEVQSNLKLVD